jgi:hypothetical protein
MKSREFLATLTMIVCSVLGCATAGADEPQRAAAASNTAASPQSASPQSITANAIASALTQSAPPMGASSASAKEPSVSTTAPTANRRLDAPATAVDAKVQAESKLASNTVGQGDSLADPLAGAVIDAAQLANTRGGSDVPSNTNNATGMVTGNVASQLTTGSNTISDSSFSNTSGIPIVIQNSGNNVLIQNSTILNLQLENPNR